MFNLLCFLYHTLPGFLMDLGLVAIGRKPRMMQIYRKVHKFCAVMSYFSNGIWRFSNNNTRRLYDRLTKEDQQLFSFDMRTVHWETLVEDSIRGLRTFVVKEDPNNVENAIKRYKRLVNLKTLNHLKWLPLPITDWNYCITRWSTAYTH